MEQLDSNEKVGIVKISNEVVSVIAGIAAEEIQGVIEFQKGVTNNITHLLKGKKHPSAGKAVKVELQDNKAVIDISLSVLYGVKIIDVVKKVQENVKKSVETMTGLDVVSINVCVQNIYLKPKKEDQQEN